MDLLLRWVTLRFFETNTTVNLKCLEFLQAAFKMLTQDGNYRMTDYEANAFLPYLVTKVHLYVYQPQVLSLLTLLIFRRLIFYDLLWNIMLNN